MSVQPPRRIPGAEHRMRFPVRVALGELDVMDQVMLRNQLRQLGGRLELDLTGITRGYADLRAAYHGQAIRLFFRDQYRDVALPLRIGALQEALDGLLPLLPAFDHAAPARTDTLHALLLPDLTIPPPLRLAGKTLGEAFIDSDYRYAWTPLGPAEFFEQARTEDSLTACDSIEPSAMEAMCQSAEARNAVQIEALCWAVDSSQAFAPFHNAWFAQDDVQSQLRTWPNLAHEPDYEAWLPVLMKAHAAPCTKAELWKTASAAGIPRDRFLSGIALLHMYRHLVRLDSTLPPPPPPTATPTPPRPSFLGRLRERLRAMRH